MTAVVDATEAGKSADEGAKRDPFGEKRIEISEREASAVSPAAWLGGLRRRLDDVATKVT